jgi:ferritin
MPTLNKGRENRFLGDRKGTESVMNEKIEKQLNAQINAETFSAYLYMSMSAWFKANGFDGFSAWMNAQAMEELQHAQKFWDFVFQRGGKVELTAVDAPKTTWESPLEIFEDALAHERKVTALINDLVDSAMEQRDHATNIFLQWFVTEQVEEEESAGDVVAKLKMLEDSKEGLFMLDRELGRRPMPSLGGGEAAEN